MASLSLTVLPRLALAPSKTDFQRLKCHNSATLQSHRHARDSSCLVHSLRSQVWGDAAQLQRASVAHPTVLSTRSCPTPSLSKMYVPDFGGKSPESRAAENLHNYFTYLAVRVVLSQLQAYNPEGYQDLKQFTDSVPNGLKDGDKYCAALMRVSPRHKQLALRIMEVRSAYSKEDFEWENMRSVAFKRMDEANRSLMCEFVMETTKLD